MSTGQRKLLMVLPELPWPPQKNGVCVRFAPIVEHLSRHHRVDLAILNARTHTGELPEAFRRCNEVLFLTGVALQWPNWMLRARTVLTGLNPSGDPFGWVTHLDWNVATATLMRRISQTPYDAILWNWGPFRECLRVRRAFPDVRIVFDVIDSPALQGMRMTHREGVLGRLQPYTTWKWKMVERRIKGKLDATIYISTQDADAVPVSQARESHVIPNGVHVAAVEAVRRRRLRGLTIGFLGTMSYEPNVAAAMRLAGRILPKVRKQIPQARLLIIGRDPVPSILALRSDNVVVTGTVADIWPLMADVDVFAFPMTIGAGLQNKLLEAMSARVPVVTTRVAAASMPTAIHSRDLVVADSDDEIADCIVRLLRDDGLNRAIGAAGQALVRSEFDWKGILERYEAAVFGALTL